MSHVRYISMKTGLSSHKEDHAMLCNEPIDSPMRKNLHSK